MNQSINIEQTQSFEKEIEEVVFQIINTAIVGLTPHKNVEEMVFFSNRDLGDEDAHDLFES